MLDSHAYSSANAFMLLQMPLPTSDALPLDDIIPPARQQHALVCSFHAPPLTQRRLSPPWLPPAPRRAAS